MTQIDKGSLNPSIQLDMDWTTLLRSQQADFIQKLKTLCGKRVQQLSKLALSLVLALILSMAGVVIPISILTILLPFSGGVQFGLTWENMRKLLKILIEPLRVKRKMLATTTLILIINEVLLT